MHLHPLLVSQVAMAQEFSQPKLRMHPLDSTTLAPRQVHRCPTHFIITVTDDLHGTNAGNISKRYFPSLPKRLVQRIL
jgi:hypothetical protein